MSGFSLDRRSALPLGMEWGGRPGAATFENSRRYWHPNQYATRLLEEISFPSNGNGRQVSRAASRSQRSINSLANAFGKRAREYAIAAKAL